MHPLIQLGGLFPTSPTPRNHQGTFRPDFACLQQHSSIVSVAIEPLRILAFKYTYRRRNCRFPGYSAEETALNRLQLPLEIVIGPSCLIRVRFHNYNLQTIESDSIIMIFFRWRDWEVSVVGFYIGFSNFMSNWFPRRQLHCLFRVIRNFCGL